MNEIRNVLSRMLSAGRKIKRMQEAYLDVGLNDTMLHDAYGDICDAVYHLIGEDTEEFIGSVTCLAMETPLLTEERRVEMLYAQYVRSHPVQPNPNTIEPNEFREMARKNGYLRETPEGDWS